MVFAEPWADCFFEYGTVESRRGNNGCDGVAAGVDENAITAPALRPKGIRNYRIEWDEPI